MKSTAPMPPPAIHRAFEAALKEASKFRGQTAPNPCVGAAALRSDGTLLCVRAHEQAGQPHAEANLLQDCEKAGVLQDIALMVVTLEPCNHQGRTPACTEAILRAGILWVIAGAADPNPQVAGGGMRKLAEAGVQAQWLEVPELKVACERLLAPFAKRCREGLPYVTLKSAWRRDELQPTGWTMLPPLGTKTFSQPTSLRLAHELRKRADAILTGSGTLLADHPDFTVRHLADFPGRSRELMILDRRGRVPAQELSRLSALGHHVRIETDLETALREAVLRGINEVLVEAGPELTEHVLATGFWDEHVIIRCEPGADAPVQDQVTHVFRNH